MPACADMGQYLLEMHQYTPQPTKHRSEDRAHNKGPGLCLDITNIGLSSINSLHRFKPLANANILDPSRILAFGKELNLCNEFCRSMVWIHFWPGFGPIWRDESCNDFILGLKISCLRDINITLTLRKQPNITSGILSQDHT